MPDSYTAVLVLATLLAGCASISPTPPARASRTGEGPSGPLGPLATDPALLGVEKGGTLIVTAPATAQDSTTVESARAAQSKLAPAAAPAPVTSNTPAPVATTATPAIAAAKPVAPATPSASDSPAATLRAPRTLAPAKPAVVPADPPPVLTRLPAPVTAVSPPAPPALDMASLKTRLRDTKAIGVFSKLALKNQMDDVLDQFRAAYKTGQKTAPAALRQPYDMLVLKVLALLQDGDPALARSVAGSREALWGILADAESFRAIA